jgi:hypothetical protein
MLSFKRLIVVDISWMPVESASDPYAELLSWERLLHEQSLALTFGRSEYQTMLGQNQILQRSL